MGLLIVGALAIAVGILLLIGVLVVTEDLFSESVFGAPEQSAEVTQRQGMDEDRSPFAGQGR
jgi:hypothetical protein